MDVGVQMPSLASDLIMRLQAVHAANLSGQTVPGFRAEIPWAGSQEVTRGEDKPQASFRSRQLPGAGKSRTNFAPGALRLTGRDLDIAVDGKGWILVQKGGQVGLTRNGQLDQDAEGRLYVGGWQVMGGGGPLALPPWSQVHVGTDGTVSVLPLTGGGGGLMPVDRIRLVNPAEEQLERGPGGVFVSDEVNEGMAADPAVRLRSGVLEDSNVDAAAELISFINLARLFEMNVAMMSAYKDTSSSGDRLVRPDPAA